MFSLEVRDITSRSLFRSFDAAFCLKSIGMRGLLQPLLKRAIRVLSSCFAVFGSFVTSECKQQPSHCGLHLTLQKSNGGLGIFAFRALNSATKRWLWWHLKANLLGWLGFKPTRVEVPIRFGTEEETLTSHGVNLCKAMFFKGLSS